MPFGQYHVNDPKCNRLNFTIHNYFLAKSLELVRPGGILAFISSRYTLDSQSTDVRSYLAERADLLGAIRLPRNAFRSSSGTDVVSDIIFLKKRDTPALEIPAWVQTEENEDSFPVKRYFISYPEMVLGTLASRSTQYGKPEYTVLPLPDADLGEQLRGVVSHIHSKYQAAVHAENESNNETDIIPADPDVKNYSFTLVNGKVYYRQNSIMKKMDLSATAKSRVVGMIVIRDCVHQLINLQLDEYVSDDEIKAKQDALNRLYDAYTCKNGLINDLRGVIFRDPSKNNWQTEDEYLSGNVRRKLRQAQKAAEQDSAYQINVDALNAAQPKDLDASEIEVRIGATWIDKSYIQQFMYEILKTPTNLKSKIRVNYSSATAQWFITCKNAVHYNDVAAYTTYCTDRANAYRILEKSFNLRDIRIYDTLEDENGKEKRVLNAQQTTLVSQKQQALCDAFRGWIFQDPERRQIDVSTSVQQDDEQYPPARIRWQSYRIFRNQSFNHPTAASG